MPTFNNLFWLILITISIELGLVSYLASWDVNLDYISMLILLMNIAFSTNRIVHVCCAYFESANYNSKKKIRNTLFTIGLPLVQSYFLKLLIVASVTLSSSSLSSINYIYLTIGKFVLILIALCAFHELLLLPVLLALSSSLCSKPNYSSDKHLHDLSDLDDQDSEDDFNRKTRKSYYKCNARQRLHDPPFYYTEKWFDGKQLTINNRCTTISIPRLIMNQPKGDRLIDDANFLTNSKRPSTSNSRTIAGSQLADPQAKNLQTKQATIWSNDEDIRNDVINKFNEHWKHMNSNFKQTDQLSNQISKNVSKQSTGISIVEFYNLILS